MEQKFTGNDNVIIVGESVDVVICMLTLLALEDAFFAYLINSQGLIFYLRNNGFPDGRVPEPQKSNFAKGLLVHWSLFRLFLPTTLQDFDHDIITSETEHRTPF